MNLVEKFKVSSLPETVYYIPNYISEAEEEQLLNHVYSAPQTAWKQLSNRRLQNWGGEPHPKIMIPDALPSWVKSLTKRLTEDGVSPASEPCNHILVNEYEPGQGILPHHDGPIYEPRIATISLGSHAVLNFYEPVQDSEKNQSLAERRRFGLLVERRSLLVLKHSLYDHLLHGIDEVREDALDDSVARLSDEAKQLADGHVLQRATRVSLTIRRVKKVAKHSVRSLIFRK